MPRKIRPDEKSGLKKITMKKVWHEKKCGSRKNVAWKKVWQGKKCGMKKSVQGKSVA